MRFALGFIIVVAVPMALLIAGSMLGGYIAVAAVFYMTVVNQSADAVVGKVVTGPSSPLVRTGIPVAFGIAHFVLLGIGVWAISSSDLLIWEKTVLFWAFGIFFGSVSNAVGHELIHRSARFPFNLGKWVFISHLFGHHTSAHRFVHHPFVATRFDPNTARYNENFYRFFARAWRGSFRTGLEVENTRRSLPPESRALPLGHPYFTYVVGAAIFLGLATAIGGIPGLITYFGLAIMAQGGLLLTDYTQHYGLLRKELQEGRFERVGAGHSWNAPHWFTRHLTLNAPLHSMHHTKPGADYTQLINQDGAPQMPYGPGIMTVIALNPWHWRRLMNPRVDALRRSQLNAA
ncbi:MAG: alkane 1-monooxygenase [Pseudomonadota bacterium]